MKLVSPGLERSAFLLKYNNIKNKWCNFSFKHYYLILFGLFVKKNIYIWFYKSSMSWKRGKWHVPRENSTI